MAASGRYALRGLLRMLRSGLRGAALPLAAVTLSGGCGGRPHPRAHRSGPQTAQTRFRIICVVMLMDGWSVGTYHVCILRTVFYMSCFGEHHQGVQGHHLGMQMHR